MAETITQRAASTVLTTGWNRPRRVEGLVPKTGPGSLGSSPGRHRRSLPLPRTLTRHTARLKFLVKSAAL
jgi:hypothetical protein